MGWDGVQQASYFFPSSSLQSPSIVTFYKHQLIGCISIIWSCFHFILYIYSTTFIDSLCYYSYYGKTLLSTFLFTFCHSPFASQLFLLYFRFQLLFCISASIQIPQTGVPPIFLMHSHNFTTKGHITLIVAQLVPFHKSGQLHSIPSCPRSILSVTLCILSAGGTLTDTQL